MKRVLIILFLVVLIYPVANGQLWKLRRYELTGSFGTSQFMGDIGGFTPGDNALGFKDLTVNNTRFALGLGLRYRILEDFSVKLDLNYGLIHASDAKGSNEGRDMEATTSLIEPGVRAEYYILKNSAESSYRFIKGQEIFASIIAGLIIFLANVPATTRPQVNLPEKCPPPLVSALPLYFKKAVISACPGRGTFFNLS